MRLFHLLLLAALSFATLPLQAAELKAEEQQAIDRLTGLLGAVRTLSGQFSQLTLDGSGTRLQESTGAMELMRPGKFRWHTDAPLEQELVSNGELIWLYDPDLEQVTIRKMDQRLTHTPALLLSGDVSQIAENFAISSKAADDVVDFTLIPRAADSLFDSLRLSFRGGLINDMQLVDSVGQRTNILFSGVKMNQDLPEEQFTFVIPPGTDVIQE
jgi:outer membrane lipoprotein carrier protein